MTDRQFLINLGKKIRGLREAKLLSLQKLADLSGCEKANLSRIEAGKTNPTALTLKKLSEPLEVDVALFFENHVDGKGR